MRGSVQAMLAAAAGIALTLGSPAQGDMVCFTLGDLSSDATPGVILDARWEFCVRGSTRTVCGDTSAMDTFDIGETCVDLSAGAAGLMLTARPGWSLPAGGSVGGCGVSGSGLIDGAGGRLAKTAPGVSQAFGFAFRGRGALDGLNPAIERGTRPGYVTPPLGAADLVNAPADDRALGAVVPAPGAALLGLIGLGTMAWLRRRVA